MALRACTAFAVLAVVLFSPRCAGAQPLASPSRDTDESALAVLALALAVAPVPQQGTPLAAGGAGDDEPRIELVVTVAARSVVFDELPRIRVAFGGAGPQRAVWHAELTNLPTPIEPGVEYHDVQVRLTLSSTLDEFESLIEDARRVASGIRMEGASP